MQQSPYSPHGIVWAEAINSTALDSRFGASP